MKAGVGQIFEITNHATKLKSLFDTKVLSISV